MANQLHIYINNPTEGKSDGTEASSGAGTSPICVTLDASKNEEKAVKCAVRCDSGFKIDGAVTVAISGESAEKWKVAADNGYKDESEALSRASWEDTLELGDVESLNVIFWAKASSSSNEAPHKDASVSITATGKVVVA